MESNCVYFRPQTLVMDACAKFQCIIRHKMQMPVWWKMIEIPCPTFLEMNKQTGSSASTYIYNLFIFSLNIHIYLFWYRFRHAFSRIIESRIWASWSVSEIRRSRCHIIRAVQIHFVRGWNVFWFAIWWHESRWTHYRFLRLTFD